MPGRPLAPLGTDIGNTADGGQFVLGEPRNNRNRRTRHRLPTVAELFPAIAKPALDKNNDLPSCSAVQALERQEPFFNQTLAFHALAMLARLLRHEKLSTMAASSASQAECLLRCQ
jgi:hypothetical protein